MAFRPRPETRKQPDPVVLRRLFQHCTSKKESGCWYHARVAAWLEASGKLVHQGSGTLGAAVSQRAAATADAALDRGVDLDRESFVLPPLVLLDRLPLDDGQGDEVTWRQMENFRCA